MEITAIAAQTVLPNQNVLFLETPIPSTAPCIVHREGSGVVKLKGLTQGQARARFKVTFNGNIAAPAGQVLPPQGISLAISLDGEPLQSTVMTVVPAGADQYTNVSAVACIDVPKCYCATLAVENINAINLAISNANLIVERVA